MNKSYILIFLLLLIFIPLSIFAWKQFRKPEIKYVSSGKTTEYVLQIKGDSECVKNTIEALDTLKVADPAQFSNVQKYLAIIDCVRAGSSIRVEEEPPRFQVGRATYASAYGSMWYTGALAHEACHSKLYRDYKLAHPNQKVPFEIYGGKPGESKCIDIQVEVLKKLGASTALIDFTKNQLNTEYWKQTNEWW